MDRALGVLIVAYARNERTIKLLEIALKAQMKNVIIWIDGAKSEVVKRSQEQLIDELQKIRVLSQKTNIQILKTKQNYGAGASILSAVSILFEKFDYGIILEDDLVVDVEFFEIMRNAIHAIEPISDFWMVTGTRLRSENLQGHWEIVNYPGAWGWGTTSEKWKKIYAALQVAPIFRVKVERKVELFWKVGYERALKGKIDAWDVPLAAIMHSNQKQCLLPPENIVTNEGFDLHAIHTKTEVWPLGLRRGCTLHGKEIVIDEKNRQINNDFFEREVYRIRNHHMFIRFYGTVLHYLRNSTTRKTTPLFKKVEQALEGYESL